jgi:histone-lysine N-methyltransferase SETMAR
VFIVVLVKCDPRFSVISEMADLKEQRIFVKLCFRLGKTASETYEILKTAFGDIAMGRTQTFEWFSRFKRGETSIEDSLRSGRPPTGRTDENVENVRKIVSENRRNTITEIAGRLGLSYGTCQRILTEDLNMRRISAKFVPRLHTEEQKQRRVFVCQELLDEVIPNASNTKGKHTFRYRFSPQTFGYTLLHLI